MSRVPLFGLLNRSIKKWFGDEMVTLGNLIESGFRRRDDVVYGLQVAVATVASPALLADHTVGEALIDGKHFPLVGAANVNVAPDAIAGGALPNISLAGVHVNVGDAALLGTNANFADCVLVLIQSDGVGAPGTAARFLVVHNAQGVAGVPTGYQVQTAIAAATAAGANYAANAGWVILGSFRATRGAANITIGTIVQNQGNHLNV